MSSDPLELIAAGIAVQAAQIQGLSALALSFESEARDTYLELSSEVKRKGECVTWEELVQQTVAVMKEYDLGWWKRAGFLTKIEIAMSNFGVSSGAIKDYKNSVHLLCKTAL